jgi:hypothetical protein
LAQALRKRCDGALLIASNTLVANADALVAVYDAQKLLLDMVERPDVVHRALEQVNRAHSEILDALAGLLDYDTYGSINRHGMYTRGRINVPQCDMSCMIGPEMFQEFVIPCLRREMDALDAVEYHLDGPGAVKHLDALCALDKLDIVQWVPGDGEAATRDWTDLYDRIDALGKGQIRGGTCDKIREMSERYRTRKLFCRLNAGTKEEAETCLQQFPIR